MFHIILHQPEIPPNTGNIIRLCANVGAQLHLIEPLGFALDEKSLRRAGLDYHHLVQITCYKNFSDCLIHNNFDTIYLLSSKANNIYSEKNFTPQDAFLFGSESSGLPEAIKKQIPNENHLVLPQQTKERSLNLSNTVAIILYEAWRQLGFN